MRPSRRGPCSASPSRSPCGSAAGVPWCSTARATGRVTTIDGRETTPAARPRRPRCASTRSGRTDGRFPSTTRATAAPRWVCPAPSRRGTRRSTRYGTISLAYALARELQVARDGFVIDQTFFNQMQEDPDFFNDIPATATLYLDPLGSGSHLEPLGIPSGAAVFAMALVTHGVVSSLLGFGPAAPVFTQARSGI